MDKSTQHEKIKKWKNYNVVKFKERLNRVENSILRWLLQKFKEESELLNGRSSFPISISLTLSKYTE